MITGVVRDFEPIIPLSVYGSDGNECVFNVYQAVVVWDGSPLSIPVDEADSDPLIGMSLMEGYQLVVQIFEGGLVELSRINTV